MAAKGELATSRANEYRSILSGLVALLLLAAAPLQAQNTQNRADVARTTSDFGPGASTSGEMDGHAVASPNDSDLGEQAILKRTEGYQPFTVSAVVPCYWTSNVALSKTDEHDDFLVAPAVALAYQPRFSPTLYGLVSVTKSFGWDE